MRTNIAPHVAPTIHRLALQRGKSDQEMASLALALGLRELGAAVAVTLDDDDRESVKLTLELPQSPYQAVKRLAKAEGCSNSSKIRDVIMVGLKALGELPDDAAPSA